MNARTFFRTHPVLRDRAAMFLCGLAADRVAVDWRTYQAEAAPGVEWKVVKHRLPPLPFSRGPLQQRGHCSLCGFEVFKHGDWRAKAGKRHPMSSWHACCGDVANTMRGTLNWKFFAKRQGWKCPETGAPLIGAEGVDIDHIVPLWKVFVEGERYTWPGVLRFWMLGNLQALSPAGHKIKCAREERELRKLRAAAPRTRRSGLVGLVSLPWLKD